MRSLGRQRKSPPGSPQPGHSVSARLVPPAAVISTSLFYLARTSTLKSSATSSRNPRTSKSKRKPKTSRTPTLTSSPRSKTPLRPLRLLNPAADPALRRTPSPPPEPDYDVEVQVAVQDEGPPDIQVTCEVDRSPVASSRPVPEPSPTSGEDRSPSGSPQPLPRT